MIRDEIDRQFPSLWRHHMLSDPEWTRLKDKLAEQTTHNIARINSATETKVSELLDSKDFEPLKQKMFDTAMIKFDKLQRTFEDDFQHKEKERNERLQTLETKMRDTQNQTWIMFLGGTVFGLGLGFLAKQ